MNQTHLAEKSSLRDRHILMFDLFKYKEAAIMGNKDGYTFTDEELMTNWDDYK